MPILDEIISDYAGKHQAFGLSVRYSGGLIGIIITLMAISSLYMINKSMIEPFWFMEAFVAFGYVMILIIVIIDRENQTVRYSSNIL